MNSNSINNTPTDYLSEDKIAETIGTSSSYSISKLSLNQISNILITFVLSEIEIDNKNINIPNTESLQFKIQDTISSFLNTQFTIYEKLLRKAENNLRYYISKSLEYKLQEQTNDIYIQQLKAEIDELNYTNNTKQNEILLLKKEITNLKQNIKELKHKLKDKDNLSKYLHINENFSPQYSNNISNNNNHHQRISSISSSSDNQSPLITEFATRTENNIKHHHNKKVKINKNTIRNISYQHRPILDTIISPKAGNMKYGINNLTKRRFTFYKHFKQNMTQQNHTLIDESNMYTQSNRIVQKKKDRSFVNEFLNILKRHKDMKHDNSNINNNTNSSTNSTNILISNRKKESSSQGKLNIKYEKKEKPLQKQKNKKSELNFITYRQNSSLIRMVNGKGNKSGVNSSNNSKSKIIKTITNNNSYNNNNTNNNNGKSLIYSGRNSTRKRTFNKVKNNKKKGGPIVMGLKYCS